ncbi:hypothetical protein M1466_00905 [Candidatus Dependentiae bacterium]|nr:hypothetical protein [Candidatus Dependentiae bacterium]
MVNILRNLLIIGVVFVAHARLHDNPHFYKMSVPINNDAADASAFDLRVSVPSQFERITAWGSPIQQFILYTSNIDRYAWSAMCVVRTWAPERRFTASYIIESCKKACANSDCQIIEEVTEKCDGYDRHKIIMAYNNLVAQRREVVFMHYFNGASGHCSGVEYAVVLANYQNLDDAVKQLRNFVRTRCKIFPL